MNETEAQELYQKIFSADRLERWESWKGHCNTFGHLPQGVDHPLADAPEKKGKWKGGMRITGSGYRCVRIRDHPMENRRYVFEHVLAAEIALGRFLPDGAVVHHNNENRLDNYSDGNLVICENRAFHTILHRRMRALEECGHADWLWCCLCQKWDSQGNLSVVLCRNRIIGRHRECHNARNKSVNAKVKLSLHNVPTAGSVAK